MNLQTKKKLLEITTSLIIIGSIGFTSYSVYKNVNKQKFDKEITVEKDETVSTTLKVDIDNFNPGDVKEYKIKFNNDNSKMFKITLNCTKNGQNDLAPFIDIVVLYGDKTIAEDKLDNFLDKPFELDESQDGVLSFKYSMDKNIGNEAQNKEANFDLNIKVE